MRIEITHPAPWGASWIAAEPPYMRRASHALAADGDVWLVDPVDGDGLDALLAELGTVRGVLQLLDRHPRDCAALAARHGVPHLRVRRDPVAGAPFRVIAVRDWPLWREAGLWWEERRALVVPESIGTAPYYLAPGARLGIHPAMRLTPPRRLAELRPDHVLGGHGDPVSGPGTADALAEALRRSRRDLPRAFLRRPGSSA